MKRRGLRGPFGLLRGEFFPFWVSILISGLMGIACFVVAGMSLDLFLGSLVFAAILAPALGMPVIVGFVSVWIWPVFRGEISLMTWFQCAVVLASVLAAIVCAFRLLQQWRIHPLAASAIVLFVSLAWISWPIWLVGSGPIAIHPVFAMNAACKDLGIWTEQRVAYRLISLGQDTAYRLPRSVLPAVLFHTSLAVLFLAPIWITQKIQRAGVVAPCST